MHGNFKRENREILSVSVWPEGQAERSENVTDGNADMNADRKVLPLPSDAPMIGVGDFIKAREGGFSPIKACLPFGKNLSMPFWW